MLSFLHSRVDTDMTLSDKTLRRPAPLSLRDNVRQPEQGNDRRCSNLNLIY